MEGAQISSRIAPVQGLIFVEAARFKTVLQVTFSRYGDTGPRRANRAGSFVPTLAVCLVVLVAACSKKPEPCRTAIRSQERSPDARLKAVVYLRKCPDEVLFTTNVSILPIDQSLPDTIGNTMVAPDALAVRVKWQANNQLTVLSFSDLAKATKQKKVGTVTIDYPEVTNPDLFQPSE
jgi:hypothetical protein